MNKKVILIISFSKIESDVRILRHISALKDDYEIWTLGFGKQPEHSNKHFEILEKFDYLPKQPLLAALTLLKRYDFVYRNTPAIKRSRKILLNEIHKVDLIFCNEVLTIGLPCLLNFQGKQIADMHEYAPLEMEDDWRFRLLLQKYYTLLCNKYLAKFDLVTSVSPSLVRKYSAEFGINCNLILNAREFQSLKPQEVDSSHIRLVHSGLASRYRRIDRMIAACKNLGNVSLDLYLVPAPHQKSTLRKLKKLASATKNVRVVDAIRMDSIPKVLNTYDAGITFIPPVNFNQKFALPNKFFDYVQARIAIITGPSPDMANMIKEYKMGYVTKGFRSCDLNELLRRIDHKELEEFKLNTNLAAEKLNAEKESVTLRSLISSLL